MLTLDHLRVLRAIDRHRSIAAAARSLHLSQPTLSHHLAAVEALIGGRLVTRTPRGSYVTELGELALAHAETILDQVEAAEREIATHVKHGASVLAVGTFPSAGAVLLAKPLGRLSEQGVAYHLTIAEIPDVERELHDRRLHLAILATEPDVPVALGEGFQSEPLFDDPFVVLLPPDHPCAEASRVELRDLARDVWISGAFDDEPAHQLLLRAFRQIGVQPQIGARVDDYGVVEALVAAGVGVALIPTIALYQLRGSVTARPISDPRFLRRFHLAWLTRPPRPAVESLAEDVRSTAREVQSSLREAGSPSSLSVPLMERDRRGGSGATSAPD